MRYLLSLLAPLVLVPLFLPSRILAQPAFIEAAKKEGKLVWYTSMAIDTSKPLLDAFVKEYPFIKAELVRAGEEQLMNRILSETRAGQWLFDAVSTSAMGALVDRHIITPYNPPERDAFLSEFKDAQGFWTGVFVNNLVLCYNTKMLPAKDAPRNYPDLLDPKWKGKMLMDSTDYDWFGTLATVWGKEKTVQYMKRLSTQNPLWRRGHGNREQGTGNRRSTEGRLPVPRSRSPTSGQYPGNGLLVLVWRQAGASRRQHNDSCARRDCVHRTLRLRKVHVPSIDQPPERTHSRRSTRRDDRA